MPEKYVRQDELPILVRHTGRTTLPQDPPALGDDRPVVCLHDAGLQSSVFIDLLGATAPTSGASSPSLPYQVMRSKSTSRATSCIIPGKAAALHLSPR